MEPIRSIEEFREILRRAKEEHEKKGLKRVSLKILEDVTKDAKKRT